MAGTKNIPPEICAVIDVDGAVLLNLGNGKYYSLNGVGAVVWQQLSAAQSPSEIAIHLVDVYGICFSDAEKDVADFIASLEHAKLLKDNG